MNQMKTTKAAPLVTEKEYWDGNSSFIQVTKQKLKSMASSRLPVLILGRSGTGKGIAARMMHDVGKGMNSPFTHMCCSKLDRHNLIETFDANLKCAQGGTLYISHLEQLSEQEAALLKRVWLRSDVPEQNVRLIVSSSDIDVIDVHAEQLDSNFSHWLYYHCLTIELPTLADREMDIECLVKAYQRQDSNIAHLSFQPSAWEVLKRYSWPGNVRQLKRCLDKLAIQAHSSIVNKDVLIDCFPSMLSAESTVQAKQAFHEVHQKTAYQSSSIKEAETKYQNLSVFKPFEEVLTDEAYSLHHDINHPALNKAIVYLYHNFKKPINMDELANHACISPSHLSYLFKHSLGMSFKQVLLRLRIVKAMELLVDNPNRQVTQVCDDVGFSDLSFFVRKFKATVGISPGVYRDQFGHQDVSPELSVVEEALAHPLFQLQVRH